MKNEKITNYVIFQIIIFFVLILINYFYLIYNDNVQKKLDSFISNEENKMRLFSLIISEIESIRAKIFYMSYATSRWELNYVDKNFHNQVDTLKKYLKLLEEGGSVEVDFKTDNIVFDNNSAKLKININKLNDKSINLAQIEIYPRIISLEKLYEEYHKLMIKKINQMSFNHNSYQLVQLIGQTQLRIKAFDPLFNSMLNQTKKLLVNTSFNLKETRKQIAIIKQKNIFILKMINTLSIVLLLIISFFILLRIRKILSDKAIAENELKLSHETLELKVKQRTQLLEDEIEKRNKAENKIREQADFLNNAINSLNHPFIVINVSTYEVILANYAARLLSSRKAVACYEMTHNLTKPCSERNHICPLEVVKQTKNPFFVEHIHYDSKGDEINVEVHAHPILDSDGNVENVIEYSIDITARKKAEQELLKAYDELEDKVDLRTKELQKILEEKEKSEAELKKLLSAIEQSPTSIVITDTKGNIEYVNPYFLKVTGYSYDEVIGQNPRVLNSGKTPSETFVGLWKTISSGNIWKGEFINKRKDGSLYEENVVISPIKNKKGEITNYVSVKENITALKKAQKKAVIANQAKSKFLANMSHEIRTPLNGLIGFLQLLSNTDLNHKQRQYLDTIILSSDALLKILNDILDFSKLENEMMELDIVEFNLFETVSSVINIFTAKAAEKDIGLFNLIDPEINNLIFGDSLKLTQVLSNLLGNAIKFTEKQGEISIVVDILDEKDNSLTIQFAIYDNGIGISKDNLDKIFESFSQSDSSITRKYGGTGLGLPISKKIIELMGGTLNVDSKVGAGSKFYFSLEFKKGQHINKKSFKMFKGKKVAYLISENNYMVSQLFVISKYFDYMELDWEVVSDLNSVNIRKYEVVFLDLFMKEPNDLKKIISNMNNIQYCFIVEVNKTEIIEQLGLNDYKILIKPVDILKLYDLFSELFLKDNVQLLEDKKLSSIHLNGKVLVAEDNEINQLLIKEYLDEFNIKYKIVSNGIEAIGEIEKDNYDLVFMDINMPEMNGLDAVQIVKNNINANIPIIALTAHALLEEQKEYTDSGFDGYLAKPINAEKLIKVLNKYLGNNEKKVDYKALADNLGVSDIIFKKLLYKFFEKSEELMMELSLKIEEKKYDDIFNIAHNIKGMAYNMSFNDIGDIFYNIESESRQGNSKKIKELYMIAVDKIDQLKKNMQED